MTRKVVGGEPTRLNSEPPQFSMRLAAALSNRRFRTLIIVVAGIPIVAAYLWRTLAIPIISPGAQPIDFFEDYVTTGSMMASGLDPYSNCVAQACWIGLGSASTFYPPVVAWLSQPMAHVDRGLLGVGALISMQLAVVLFLWTAARALDLRDWQAVAAAALLLITFPPLIDQMVQRNIEVLLLAISGVWLMGWVGRDRWWAGGALGVGLALKIVQAPLLVLSIWGRRKYIAAAALLVLGFLWLVGAPQYLPEYFLKVAPALNTGTGYAMDIAPVGALARLLHPGSIFGQGTGVDTTVRLISAGISAAVIVATAIVLWSPRADRTGRALEAAAVVAATPLVVAVVRPGHMLLLLLPILVLASIAIRERDRLLGATLLIAWVLTGPAYLWYTNLVAAGLRGFYVAPGEEMALAGMVILWIATLRTLHAHQRAAIRSVGQAVPVTP